MHVLLASKILKEIKSRSIDKLQDIEDELMANGVLSGENKTDFNAFLNRETDTPSAFMDKMRMLLIYIFCCRDKQEIKVAIEMVKAAHPHEFNEAFVESLLKDRKKLEDAIEEESNGES